MNAMNSLQSILHDLLPLLAAIALVMGIRMKRVNYILTALWVSLIALVLHYQTAGGEILGSYFGYKNSAIYSINIIVLIVSILYLLGKVPFFQTKLPHLLTGFISAFLVIAAGLLLINLWVNAVFIENKHPDTPILQVATMTSLNYCNYRYVFYRIGKDGKIGYLCPNYYGIIPSVGHLDVTPDFILNHLTASIKAKGLIINKGN
jgi:hypothetical protein